MTACQICANSENNRAHSVREMMFGLREIFPYVECGQCGCLQLLQIPADMSRYYPRDYYSFQTHGALKTFVRHQWSSYAYHGRNLVGKLVSRFFVPNGSMQAIRRSGISRQAKVLDVGCGSGRLLLDLAYLGFTDLSGADPFISADIIHPEGPRVYKRQLAEMTGTFDLIMLHHSFEHMSEPARVMAEIDRLLRPGGELIVRIPVASSHAWRTYGVDWVNLDAPRHFFLHTFKSMEILASRAGWRTGSIVHEGNDEQFWMSEQYARDIPSQDPRSLSSSPWKRLLAWNKIRRWQKMAADVNRRQEADLVCFHFHKNKA